MPAMAPPVRPLCTEAGALATVAEMLGASTVGLQHRAAFRQGLWSLMAGLHSLLHEGDAVVWVHIGAAILVCLGFKVCRCRHCSLEGFRV